MQRESTVHMPCKRGAREDEDDESSSNPSRLESTGVGRVLVQATREDAMAPHVLGGRHASRSPALSVGSGKKALRIESLQLTFAIDAIKPHLGARGTHEPDTVLLSLTRVATRIGASRQDALSMFLHEAGANGTSAGSAPTSREPWRAVQLPAAPPTTSWPGRTEDQMLFPAPIGGAGPGCQRCVRKKWHTETCIQEYTMV